MKRRDQLIGPWLVEPPQPGMLPCGGDTVDAIAHVDGLNRVEARVWLHSRPASVRALMRRFPWGAHVRSAPGESHVCPQEVGMIASWTEGGDVSVVELGNPIRGFCDPDKLLVIDRGPLADVWDGWLDEAEAQRP